MLTTLLFVAVAAGWIALSAPLAAVLGAGIHLADVRAGIVER